MGLFRKSSEEPIGVTMAGVKLGQRVLAVGTLDPRLVAQLAAKSGLTGRACIVDDDEARLAAAAAAIERQGALIEPIRAPYGMWPFDPDSFDVAIIPQLLPTMRRDERTQSLFEVFRVLRPGGRVLAIEAARRGGVLALFEQTLASNRDYDGAAAALRAAGFGAVRQLAEADGVAYIEGVKRA